MRKYLLWLFLSLVISVACRSQMASTSEVEYYKRLVHSQDSVIFELRIRENSLRNTVQLKDFQVEFYKQQYTILQTRNRKKDVLELIIIVAATLTGYLISQNL